MRAARGALKRMDKEVQTRLSKLTLEGRVVYFVTGHGERSTRPRPGDKPGLRDAKEAFEQLNYKVKTISAGTGLTQRVPEDATLVVVAAPEGPMLSSELEALLAYLDSGGRLLLLLDPQVERPTELEPLTQRLGIKMRSGQVLTHDKEFVQLTKTKADRQFLMAKRFVAHDSTPVLNKISGRAGLLTHTCGGLEKAKAGAGAAAKVVFTVKSMPGTWADLDGDLDFDKDTETRRVQNIVAAVEFPDLDGAPGGRAIVTADADVVSDKVLRFSAVNQQFIVDAIGWLEGSVSLSGEVADLEDVPLMHTRTEDQILFYTTVVAMPSLLLLFGFAARRLGRRPRREGRR